jgi:hypothetical protein
MDQLRRVLLEVGTRDAHVNGPALVPNVSVPRDASGRSYWLIW